MRVVTKYEHLYLIRTDAKAYLPVGFAHQLLREHLLPYLFPQTLHHLIIDF